MTQAGPGSVTGSVLAVGAHPDDVEFGCAGTLALLAQRGFAIHIATMGGGELGSVSLPPQQIRETRLKEAEAAAQVIGAQFYYAGGYDGEIDYSPEYRRRAIRLLRTTRPDIVLTHAPADYMIDHEETSRLIRNACFLAPTPNSDCGEPLPAAPAVPHLYYWDATGRCDIFGRPLPLTIGVDVSHALDIKEQMLACHASQRDWLRHHHNIDQYLDDMRQTARARGSLFGCAAAEGFIQHLGSGYPQDNVLASLLGDLCLKPLA